MTKTLPDILPQIKHWHRQRQKIVLVTGVFDLFHLEHHRFLEKAKTAGDKLVVGLETDTRVRQIKGSHRPINSQAVRLDQIAGLNLADLVFLLPEQFNQQSDWENLINTIKPSVLAVSSHTSHLENKREILRKFGGQVKIVHRFNPTHSTSGILANLQTPIKYQAKVKSGHGRGKGIGFPTLNLSIPSGFPYAQGIYAGWVWLGSKKYQGAFHFGPVPTFSQPKPSLEVFLLNRKADIPQRQVTFKFIAYLRPVYHFQSVSNLKAQIAKDVRQVKAILAHP